MHSKIHEIIQAHQPPCISLYQPTHRYLPENKQDSIRFSNLVRQMEDSLKQKYPKREVWSLLEPFQALAKDSHFWNHTLDGLAVLAAPGMFKVYKLQRPVPELVVVAESFHIKPLIRIYQSAECYQILALTRQEIKLYEGNRDVLDEVELAPGVPKTIYDALGEELTEPHQTVASYGMGTKGPAMHHGHGAKKDEVDSDTERFFRAVDRAILEHHSRPSGLPLLLAALPEHHGVFRQVSHNPLLMEEGMKIYPEALDTTELRLQAWQKVEPFYLKRLAGLVEEFNSNIPRELATSDLAEAARAAAAGRIGTLLVEAERKTPGMIDKVGKVRFQDINDPNTDDILDDLSEMVLGMKGEVVVVPAERMPTDTGIAAIYRY